MAPDLRQRLRQAGLASVGQRREVTILFADLSGYTQLAQQLDSEDLYDLLQQFINLLANDVYRFEGTIDKFTGDGLMAVFGAPLALENHAEMAIRSALDMQADVARLGQEVRQMRNIDLTVRIGLHSGEVTLGEVGSNLMMNYTAVGDAVNLAQRLEAIAEPGAILTSESVYQKTAPLFEFKKKGELALKGFRDVVACYQVKHARSKAGTLRGVEGLSSPMVGREEELKRLTDEVMHLTNQKSGRFILITGEAGIGKTRMVQELKKAIGNNRSLNVLEGQGHAYQESVSYGMVLDLIRTYLEITSQTPEAEVKAKLWYRVERAVKERAHEIVSYIEYLLVLSPSEPELRQRIYRLEPNQLRQQVFLAIRDLIALEAQRHPALIILDDLHWADQASLDLLHFLLSIIPITPLGIIAVTRPVESGGLERVINTARQNLEQHFTQVMLQNLSPRESEELLIRLLDTPEIPTSLQDEILKRTAGIPFYLEEILRMLIDGGYLQREAQGWRVKENVDFRQLSVPSSLQGLLLARFDRLSSEERHILQVAAVIGNQFSLDLLKRVLLQIKTDDIGEVFSLLITFSLLIDREFIAQADTGDGDTYHFKHVLMSDAIYRSLLRRERAQLHEQTARAIEALYADHLEEHVEVLAQHYKLSSQPALSAPYLLRSGQKAAHSYDHGQARTYYEQALEVMELEPGTAEQELYAHMGLGDVLNFLGEYEPARAQYITAVTILDELGQAPEVETQRSMLQRKIGTTFERQGAYDDALQHFARAQETLARLPESSPLEMAHIASEVGWIYFRRMHNDLAEAHLLRGLDLLKEEAAPEVRASIYNRLGGIYNEKGQLETASQYVKKSLALRQQIGDTASVARSFNNLGLLDWKLGNWKSANDHFLNSFRLLSELGDVEGVIDLHCNLGLLQLDQGDIQNASKHFEQAQILARRIGHAYILAITFNYMSRLHLLTENWGAALENAHRSQSIFEEMGAPDPEVYINLGWAWLGLRDDTAAQQWLKKAMDWIQMEPGQSAGASEERGRTVRLMGMVLQMKNEHDQARQLIQESIDIFNTLGHPVESSRSKLILASLEVTCGNAETAQACLDEARAVFERCGAELDLQHLQRIADQL